MTAAATPPHPGRVSHLRGRWPREGLSARGWRSGGAGRDDAAAPHDDRPVGHREGGGACCSTSSTAQPCRRRRPDHRQQGLDDERGEAQAHLVDQQHAGPGRPGRGRAPASAARHPTAGRPGGRGRDGSGGNQPVASSRRPRPPSRAGQPQRLAAVSDGNSARPSGTWASPPARACGPAGTATAADLDRPGEPVGQPGHRQQGGGLAGAVGPEQRHHLARSPRSGRRRGPRRRPRTRPRAPAPRGQGIMGARPRPGRRRRRPGRRGSPPGGPTAMMRPRSSTWTRPHERMTRPMSWSTSRTDTPWAGQAADDLAERRGLVGVEAGGRLVEQHEPRPRGEGAPEVDQPLPAVGQRAGAGLGLRGEAEPFDDLVDTGAAADRAGATASTHQGPPMRPPGGDGAGSRGPSGRGTARRPGTCGRARRRPAGAEARRRCRDRRGHARPGSG